MTSHSPAKISAPNPTKTTGTITESVLGQFTEQRATPLTIRQTPDLLQEQGELGIALRVSRNYF